MLAFNHQVAEQLNEIAQLLRAQQANPFRINAYLHAASELDHLDRNVKDILREDGIRGLVALPAIGEGIAHSIYEYVTTGRMSRLENLRGGHDPLAFFRNIPTIGRTLAERIHEELQVDNLQSLKTAVRNGQLEKVAGLGSKRREAIKSWLRSHDELQQKARPATQASNLPSVELVLRVDQEYRDNAAADRLPRITPKRFNPGNKAWLPIMHVSHDDWHFTALYSNTARAHQLGHTRDWVVIYYYDDQHHHEDQHTVVTEVSGKLKGRRVVRGREAECLQYYDSGVS